MKKIQTNLSNTLIINKSEFITKLFIVNNVEDVNLILTDVRKKYYDASHNCYAYILGSNQEIQKSSDDGEPSKTAGAPMLDVLKKNELTSILAITTRYFGGILLGAGGLIRAYSSSVSEALKKATFVSLKQIKQYKLTLDYPTYNNLLPTLSKHYILNTTYLQNVIVYVGVLIDNEESFINTIQNNAKGNISIQELPITEMEIPYENI